jgi:hypothetical protein
MSAADLRIARNTLFALHGYSFKSKDLREYFSRYFWYIPDSRVQGTAEILTERERQILLFNQEYEER